MQLFLLLIFTFPLFAEPWTVGNSGAPGTQSCASSCHGEGAGSVEVHGFPESYYPDSSYLIRLTSTGLSIKNFNASCRVGTTSLNAGVLLGEGMTANYSVANESNGVHAIEFDQDTLEFRWIAPVHGTGEVRLYVAAHQGHDTGPNNDLMLVSDEIFVQQPPDVPSHPFPTDGATNVSVNVNLHWDEVVGADSFRVYFGTTDTPPLVTQQTSITFAPGQLDNATQYFWRIEAINEVGVTVGPSWNFTTEQSSGSHVPFVGDFMLEPPFPNPFNGTTTLRMQLIGNVPLTIDIYNVQGRFVETLFSGISQHGRNEFLWRANGSAGVYFIRANINHKPVIYKVLYLK